MPTDESAHVGESNDENRAETDSSQGRRGFLKKAAVTGILGMAGTTIGTGAASVPETPESEHSGPFVDGNAVTADYSVDTRVSPTDDLNTRAQPGLGGEVVATMPPHATGVILSGPLQMDGYTWQIVGWDGNYYVGWCAAEYLDNVGSMPDPGYGGVVNATANLNTRAQPGLDGEVVTTVPDGSSGWVFYPRLEVGDYVWRPVVWDGSNYVGWCAGYLAIIA
ncbi:SH3 domain-containing protein [Halocatena pleomorpha]|uniref:SH3 domain-containing protein n=1 Tax=Halocatena pleomorpha TaxID=1785090 RepID=A0A3P3RA12_9EURY|nr:hypothetical protein [Halocatena pleomorpha]RRJ29510.1 hypothetical protein EIK79_12800 [Halocatena pleomorpha]